MCRILSAKQPINLNVILTFYERRLKRIVPLYLTVIAFTIFSLYYFVASIQFHQIVEEALPSLFFVSNWPRAKSTDYFDSVSSSIEIFPSLVYVFHIINTDSFRNPSSFPFSTRGL
jgi:peptidoglycan/LPS O-acetylase OafA/YrhL